MKFWINVTNNEIFQNLGDLLYGDNEKVSKWFGSHFVGELEEELSPQYEIQVKSLSEMRRRFGKKFLNDIEGIYWGTEQCEWLTPTLSETKLAIEQLKEFNKKYNTHSRILFSFLTSYWGSEIVGKRILENLQYLNDNAYKINNGIGSVEIIVNDIGTIQMIKEYGFKNLKIVFGRLLCKQLKMPLVDEMGLDENIKLPGTMIKNKTKNEIEEMRKEFANNQRSVLSRSSLHTKYFTNFMKINGSIRGGLDYSDQYGKLFSDHTVNVDVYYPYALVFVGRLCDTSSLNDQKRGYYPLDKVCPRTCTLYDLCVTGLQQNKFKLFQRGNAQFRSVLNLDQLSDEFINDGIYEHRLIYTPLI